MRKRFKKPTWEMVCFDNDVITISNCACFDGTTDWGAGANDPCPNWNDPKCTCKLNTSDPSLGNCS